MIAYPIAQIATERFSRPEVPPTMSSRWADDQLHRKAKKEGYRSRAAYKFHEIQRRYHLVRRDDNVIDLGAAPGSWLQVIRSLTDGMVMGIDLNYIPPLDGVRLLTGDFSSPEITSRVHAEVPVVNVVVCDAAPKLSGNHSYDQARAIAIGEEALRFTHQLLKRGGNFVVKSFQGDMFDQLVGKVREKFLAVHLFRPNSTRKGSSEIYIIAKNYRG